MTSIPNPEAFYQAVYILETNNIPIESFLRRLFAEPRISSRTIVSVFTKDVSRVLDFLRFNERTGYEVDEWMKMTFSSKLKAQVRDISQVETGYHFVAKSATVERLKQCSISQLAKGMIERAPDVWDLVGTLLQADPEITKKREKARRDREKARSEENGARRRKARSELEDDDDDEENLVDSNEDEPEDIEDQLETQWRTLLKIKQITCISIMMHATNQKCNTFQTLVGMFLQACIVPDATRKLLAHLGISVATSTIETATKSLSKEAFNEMRRLGASFETAYAYDNLDLDIKPVTPTWQHTTKETLAHLTTAAMFPLNHGIRAQDLDYSDFMWNLAKNPPLPATTLDLLRAVPSQPADAKGLRARDRFNAWKFRYDLVHFGPMYFAQFKDKLGDPEEVESIPVIKTKQTPMRASKIGPSTPAKNAMVLEEFFKQSAIGDVPEPSTTSPTSNSSSTEMVTVAHIGNHVVLVFGDLLTVQHIRSLQQSRLNDISPWRRFQFIICAHGWFHVRMACAQTIWRRHINAPGAKCNAISLIAFVAQIRPQERPKIESDPSFRQMHEVITHVGIPLRLDAWLQALKKRHPDITSLSQWATTVEPTWEEIHDMSEEIVKDFLPPVDLQSLKKNRDDARDKQFEVVTTLHQDFLLYEETNYAMNYGDIGRLDQCMLIWMNLFMGCGKTKYAMEMRQYLENMYIHYPKPLVNAIRLNMLSNPTGRKGHFRGIDWEIELLNMYIKRYYGGKDSNHSVDRMVNQSPLVEIYKNIRVQFEEMFCLTHKTTRHSPANMKLTFAKAMRYMEKHRANEFIPGRDSEYEIMDMRVQGMTKLVAVIERGRKKQKSEAEHLDGLEKGSGEQKSDEGATVKEPAVEEDLDFSIEDDGSLFV